MSNGPLWSVKGIDDETREIARRAAEASGLTIGNWIDSAILERTSPGEAPAPAPIETARQSPPAPAAAPVPPAAAVNGVQRAEAVAAARPPPRFVRLVEDPLPPLETDRPPTEFAAYPRPRRRFRLPAAKWMIVGAVVAVVVAAAWLETEFFGRGGAGPSIARDSPAAIADASAASAGAGTAGQGAAADDGAATVARLRGEAEKGNAFAANDLGLLYATGRHVPLDEREALTWFERAAAKGLVSAKFNVGAMYQRGRGVAPDLQVAAQWYRRAAEEGHIMAQHNLAMMYSRGEGVPQDHAAAAQLYARAAEAGFAASQFRLAELHEAGLGVKKDKKAAIDWYGRAAAQGIGRAQDMVRRLQAEPPPAAGRAAQNAAKSAATRETIRETQQLLSRLNFEPGAVDGRYGPQTGRAIRDFQRAAGLQVNGAASPELLDELKAIASTMAR